MPNYRSKNKNKRNKNRGKNNNPNKNNEHQQQQQQQQQQHHQAQSQTTQDVTTLHDEKLMLEQPATADDRPQVGCAPNVSTVSTRIYNDDDDSIIAHSAPPPTAQTPQSTPQAAAETISEASAVDIVSRDAGTEGVCASVGVIQRNDTTLDGSEAGGMNHRRHKEMAAKSGKKPLQISTDLSAANAASGNDYSEIKVNSASQQCGKVIVHRIVRARDTDGTCRSNTQAPASSFQNEVTTVAEGEQDAQTASKSNSPNVIIHHIAYRVESPPTTPEESRESENLAFSWQVPNAINSGQDDMPLFGQPDIFTTKSCETFASKEQDSGGAAEHMAAYSQLRAQKRAAIEDHFLPQFLSPRYLDSIMEENSDASDGRSEASSDLAGSGTNFGHELKDEFGDFRSKKCYEIYPRIALDFAKKHKRSTPAVARSYSRSTNALRADTSLPPTFVEARIYEPTVEEGCASWSSMQTPECEAAEVVYINSASSSTSDLMDLDDEESQAEDAGLDLNTDISQIFGSSKGQAAGKTKRVQNDEEKKSAPVEACGDENHETSTAQAAIAGEENDATKANSKTNGADTTTTTTTLTPLEADDYEEEVEEEEEQKPCIALSEKSERLFAEREKSDTPSAFANRTRTRSASERSEISQSHNTSAADAEASTIAASCVSNASLNEPSFSGTLANSPMNDIREILNGAAAKENVSPPQGDAAPVALLNHEIGKNDAAIKKLRLLCTQAVASLPYGEEILEELASVAQNIGEVRCASRRTVDRHKNGDSMPYPLPQLPNINQLHIQSCEPSELSEPPPPIPQPPHKYDSWLGVPTETNPKLLVCLSPSQRCLISAEKPLNRRETDNLLDAHQKFVERRGYHEYSAEQVKAINHEEAAEQQIIQTAAMMKEKRKSLTPPPPPVPPLPAPRQQRAAANAVKLKSPTKTNDNNNNSSSIGSTAISRGSCRDEHDSLFSQENENKHRLLTIIHGHSNKMKPNDEPSASVPVSATASAASTSSCEINPHTNNDPTTMSQAVQNLKQYQSSSSVPTSAELWRPARPQSPSNNQKLAGTEDQNKDSATSNKSFEHSAATSLHSKKSSFRTSSSTTTTATTTTAAEQLNPLANSARKFPEKAPLDHKMSDFGQEFSPTFPARNRTDGMHAPQQRFSNIETLQHTPFYADETTNVNLTKRFSNIETTTSESRKRIENGQVVYDTNDSSRESFTVGQNRPVPLFPVKELPATGWQSWPFKATNEQKCASPNVEKPTVATSNINGIMSALNLNTPSAADGVRKPPPTLPASTETLASSSHCATRREVHESLNEKSEIVYKNKQRCENSTFDGLRRSAADSFEEFRQGAKTTAAPAEQQSTSAPVKTTSKSDGRPTSAFHFDREKIFKDFDELSQQLNKELESGRLSRGQRERSASLYDLSRLRTESKTRFDELKRQRHEHMQELEREIERSVRSRQFKTPLGRDNLSGDAQCGNGEAKEPKQPQARTVQIPIRMESNDFVKTTAKNTYQIPVRLDADYGTVTSPQQTEDARQYVADNMQRRAESMFDLSSAHKQAPQGSNPARDCLAANGYATDDWNRYATDFGLSENITRPFAREVEICYQRCRPNTIRAPRLTASNDDLSSQKSRPQYLSCHSMIERDPNPTYVSTTSRRGVSPVPPAASAPTPHRRPEGESGPALRSDSDSTHERQLQYITCQEQELRSQFERLESERRRLLEEMRRVPNEASLPPTRSARDAFRSTPKLPTLSEEEVFRQQMAEEWLSKIAEREERRLQKIIKISKINDQEAAGRSAATPTAICRPKSDIRDEFLKRVQERRTKLAMPADSDWESGAESQPTPNHQPETSQTPPSMKVIEGQAETNPQQLPKHLLEFAKFSNHESEQLNNGRRRREVHQEEERRQEGDGVTALSSAVKRTSIVKTYKVARRPESQRFGSAGEAKKRDTEEPPEGMVPPQGASQHDEDLRHTATSVKVQQRQSDQRHHHHHQQQQQYHHRHRPQLLPPTSSSINPSQGNHRRGSPKHLASTQFITNANTATVAATACATRRTGNTTTIQQQNEACTGSLVKRRKQTRFLLSPNRRSCSESDLLREIDDELQLAKGFLYAGENNTTSTTTTLEGTTLPSPHPMFAPKFKARAPPGGAYERSASTSELPALVAGRQTNNPAPAYRPHEVIYNVKREYSLEPASHNDGRKKMAQLQRRQYDGIGPVTTDGMPIVLRSEVKEPHQHEWYKRLYQTIHKQKNSDDYVIRYKCPRGRSSYQQTGNGCISEPEPSYDSDYSTVKYRTLDRKRLQPLSLSSADTRSTALPGRNDAVYGTMPNPIKAGQNLYKNQPGRIEDYTTGHSSVSEKEKREWWDEVMDIFNGHLEQSKLSTSYTEGNLSRALAKESGYASDSNLVFRKRQVPLRNPLSPVEQKQAYKSVQAGGQPPLFGFQKPAPEKPKESPNRYFESDVNIHYKTPVRYEYKDPIAEEELAMRQAEQMQKLYQEERRRKYLQELQDMNSRRHADNFTPSQKSPIPLNRYEDFQADLAPKTPSPAMSPRTVARALYNFQGQTARELSFRKGDVIYIRRKIDKNWYEGEHNAMIGLLPASYVELITKDGVRQPPRRTSEGQARAKYNFQAQSGIELSLNKGELVTLTRRVDDNWFEGKIANRKGIFPVSYVEILSDIGSKDYSTPRAVMNQRPSLETLRANVNDELNAITQNGHHTPNGILRDTRNTPTTDMLHVDTSTNPLSFRALYKYRPQNSDELELQEGDIVHVLEKCDDGWFVGTSQRTGYFGTFPGNYVERV